MQSVVVFGNYGEAAAFLSEHSMRHVQDEFCMFRSWATDHDRFLTFVGREFRICDFKLVFQYGRKQLCNTVSCSQNLLRIPPVLPEMTRSSLTSEAESGPCRMVMLGRYFLCRIAG